MSLGPSLENLLDSVWGLLENDELAYRDREYWHTLAEAAEKELARYQERCKLLEERLAQIRELVK